MRVVELLLVSLKSYLFFIVDLSPFSVYVGIIIVFPCRCNGGWSESLGSKMGNATTWNCCRSFYFIRTSWNVDHLTTPQGLQRDLRSRPGPFRDHRDLMFDNYWVLFANIYGWDIREKLSKLAYSIRRSSFALSLGGSGH